MATPYSTETELRNNVFKLTSTSAISSVQVVDKITKADNQVQVDIGTLVDFDLVDAGVTPDYINKLSQFKTAELCLVYVFGAKRTVEDITDITYWMDQYNKLVEAINNMEVDLGEFAGASTTFTNTSKAGVKPILGIGKHGQFKSDEDLAEDRPLDD